MAWQREAAYQEKSQLARWPQNAEEPESMGGLLGELASQSAGLVRDEVALARQEIREKLKAVQSAAIVIAVASVLALVSLLALCSAAILALAQYLKPWQSALAVGLVLAIVASIVAFVGIGQLKRTNLKPEQTIETLEENKEWLKEIT
jgi:uncharacterized membrane protein YqjE